jgi:hypothetical protein
MKQRTLLAILLITLVGCELKHSSIIDPVPTIPVLLSAWLSQNEINTDTITTNNSQAPQTTFPISFKVYAKVDFKGIAGNVTVGVSDPVRSTAYASLHLHNDGVAPDTSSADSIFSGTVSMTIDKSFVGPLQVAFGISTDDELRTNSILLPLTIKRNNTPPTIGHLIAADTVTLLSSSQLIVLMINATDVDGQADIQRVQFKSYIANDTIPRSTIQMYDDGGKDQTPGNGNTDKFPGDGVYTVTVELPPTASKGTRRFEFQAFDRSNTGSNIINHFIVIN